MRSRESQLIPDIHAAELAAYYANPAETALVSARHDLVPGGLQAQKWVAKLALTAHVRAACGVLDYQSGIDRTAAANRFDEEAVQRPEVLLDPELRSNDKKLPAIDAQLSLRYLHGSRALKRVLGAYSYPDYSRQ
jgi:hypothetical protein